MSFDKLHKWWNRQSAIVVVYVVVMLLPNVLLAITEPYSFTTVTASLLMPGAVYLLLAVALKRPGLLMLCSFPLMVLGAFQIVLLYLFGGSIIAVDMFTNLFTTNASEAGELLGNIWPSIVFVIVLYVPLIVLAVRSLLLRERLGPVPPSGGARGSCRIDSRRGNGRRLVCPPSGVRHPLSYFPRQRDL